MKKLVCLLMIFVLVLSFCSCSKTENEFEEAEQVVSESAEETDTSAKEEEEEEKEEEIQEEIEIPDEGMTVEKFAAMANGYWVSLAEHGNSCEILYVYDENFQTGVYPGSWDRTAAITAIEETGDKYCLTLLFPEEESLMDGYMPETESVIYVSSPDNFEDTLVVSFPNDDYKLIYEFAGSEEEGYATRCEELING